MEENVDSINENINDSLNNKDENNQVNVTQKNPTQNFNDPQEAITMTEVNDVMNKEKLVAANTNDEKIKPKKEIPIEKKPFNEFVNDHLLPSLKLEFKQRGFQVEEISLKNDARPIAGGKCWVIYCEIKNSCNFWLSFEKADISSLKSISLCRPKETPSIIESFLIDEKRITLKLIISRILQRLNGQKLIGVN